MLLGFCSFLFRWMSFDRVSATRLDLPWVGLIPLIRLWWIWAALKKTVSESYRKSGSEATVTRPTMMVPLVKSSDSMLWNSKTVLLLVESILELVLACPWSSWSSIWRASPALIVNSPDSSWARNSCQKVPVPMNCLKSALRCELLLENISSCSMVWILSAFRTSLMYSLNAVCQGLSHTEYGMSRSRFPSRKGMLPLYMSMVIREPSMWLESDLP